VIRGQITTDVVIATTIDPYMTLRALAKASGLSTDTLYDHCTRAVNPLPHFRPGGPGGKILVQWSAFCAWMEQYRHRNAATYQAAVAALEEMRRAAPRPLKRRAESSRHGPAHGKPLRRRSAAAMPSVDAAAE
jgi:hypothetical protein